MKKAAREEDRLNRIERQVQEIAKEVSKIASIISKDAGPKLALSEVSAEPNIASKDVGSRLSLSKAQWENVNPWALQTVIDLGSALASEIAPLHTYNATITVLKSAEAGCTAEEVSQKTGRRRNTESGYLNRLYKAGFLKKVKIGRKTKYILEDKEMWNTLSQTG
jgi:hypothetical protein